MKEECLLNAQEAPHARSMLTRGRVLAAFCLVVLGCTLWSSVEKNTEKATAYSEATVEEVAMAAACSFSVEFKTMSGNVENSGSSTGATMQFLIGGVWSNPMWLFHSVGTPWGGATSGEMVKKQFAMDQWPTEMRIAAGGNDALGYSRITFVVGSVRVPVVHAPSNIDLSYPFSGSGPSTKYWVDGDEAAPRSNTFNVPELSSGTFTVVFETMSGNVENSGSSTGATMQFLIGGVWSNPMWLFHSVGNPWGGATSGEKVKKQFAMDQWPTEMRIAAGGNDALGYQRIDFVLSTGAEYNIVNAPSNIDLSYPLSGSGPSMKYWVDGDEAAPRSNTFLVPPKPCPGR